MSAHCYDTLGLRLFLHYGVARKTLVEETFKMEKVKILPTSAFVGHGFAQHSGSERREEHYVRYQRYFFTKNFDLADAVASAYGDSVASDSKRAAVFLE